MFWQETSFPENTRHTAYNVHSFHLLGELGRARPGFNFGGHESGRA